MGPIDSWWCDSQLLPYCLKGTLSVMSADQWSQETAVGVALDVGLVWLHKHLINDDFRDVIDSGVWTKL